MPNRNVKSAIAIARKTEIRQTADQPVTRPAALMQSTDYPTF